jgi:glc operon protein GlcG
MITLTLSCAEECIRRIKTKATELRVNMSIAVVDEAGELVAYARMGQNPGSFAQKLAIAKAKTAVAYGGDTKTTLEHFATRQGNYYIVGMAGLYPGEFWAGPGGVSLIEDGKVVGGVGVSGSSPEDDHKCVTEALSGLTIKDFI